MWCWGPRWQEGFPCGEALLTPLPPTRYMTLTLASNQVRWALIRKPNQWSLAGSLVLTFTIYWINPLKARRPQSCSVFTTRTKNSPTFVIGLYFRSYPALEPAQKKNGDDWECAEFHLCFIRMPLKDGVTFSNPVHWSFNTRVSNEAFNHQLQSTDNGRRNVYRKQMLGLIVVVFRNCGWTHSSKEKWMY